MEINRKKHYDRAEEFFYQGGSAVMQLTTEAAIDVCRSSSARGLLVLGVEGGNHNSGFFTPDGACIWDGDETAINDKSVSLNNERAAEFIIRSATAQNAYVITTVSFETE